MSVTSEETDRRCPDGGKCHHECQVGCYRVECCGPLSGVYLNDEWPDWLTDILRVVEPIP